MVKPTKGMSWETPRHLWTAGVSRLRCNGALVQVLGRNKNSLPSGVSTCNHRSVGMCQTAVISIPFGLDIRSRSPYLSALGLHGHAWVRDNTNNCNTILIVRWQAKKKREKHFTNGLLRIVFFLSSGHLVGKTRFLADFVIYWMSVCCVFNVFGVLSKRSNSVGFTA